MTPLEILKAARAKIEKPECWGKGYRPETYDEAFCALEAIAAIAADECGLGCRSIDSIHTLLRKGIGVKRINIIKWNDAPERTHSDVLKAFDRAIELAQAQSVSS